MTTRTQLREQVEAYVAGRILKRLAKLGASEEGELRSSVRGAVTTRTGTSKAAERHTKTERIPGSVYDATLRKLLSLGQVRRVKITSGHLEGIVVVARRDATGKEITKAAWTKFDLDSRSRVLQSTFFRREMHRRGVRESRLADAIPLTDPDELHYSEHEDAMTHEGSVAPDPFEAEIPADSETANVPVHDPRGLVVTEEIQKKIAYQDKIGQGPRNARRARARHLENDPVMQQWFARKEMEENARREERRAFLREAPDDH